MIYVLRVDCNACQRIAGCHSCALCGQLEDAERRVGNYPPSPQLTEEKTK